MKLGTNNPDDFMKSNSNFAVEYYDNGQLKTIGGKRLERNGKIPVISDSLKEYMDKDDR